jgi:proteasome assembly chaperone (PAC2) family protein
MSGLIIGVAKLREMHGTCILVETSGYVIDTKSHKYFIACQNIKTSQDETVF